MGDLSSCLSYLESGGAVPKSCCKGIKSLNAAAKDTPARQTAYLALFYNSTVHKNKDNKASLISSVFSVEAVVILWDTGIEHAWFVRSSLLLLKEEEDLPSMFVRKHQNDFSDYVTLKVPNDNVWNVRLRKIDDKFYLCDGWKDFADHHSICAGHFMTFRYEGSCRFDVMICDMSMVEIDYPCNTDDGYGHSFNKVGKGKQQLPIPFAQTYIPKTQEAVRIIDLEGRAWYLKYKFSKQHAYFNQSWNSVNQFV
ncbi:B3 domain-containing transcription factor vrn1 [Thalictrum thalictroides]|uniref:B3 domain-containing transcription factor vrn1 n=1 Tax=Thalictrum thalictroides TaxID=46969 RepID=A0A7J6XCF1_THATH|nr:B3 domain-containing transcription factor vrn1 [Thalictrum thalictroides]